MKIAYLEPSDTHFLKKQAENLYFQGGRLPLRRGGESPPDSFEKRLLPVYGETFRPSTSVNMEALQSSESSDNQQNSANTRSKSPLQTLRSSPSQKDSLKEDLSSENHPDWEKYRNRPGDFNAGLNCLPESQRQLFMDNLERLVNFRAIHRSRLEQQNDFDKRMGFLTNPPIIHYNGEALELQKLGYGGTKETYLTKINGQDVVLAIGDRNWRDIFEEIERTRELRQRGFLVNDFSEMIPIQINGHTFMANAMKPFTSHSFSIYDHKNPAFNPPVTQALSKKAPVEALERMLYDIHMLAKGYVDLPRGMLGENDSVNIAVKDGFPRVFIMDIPYSKNSFYTDTTAWKPEKKVEYYKELRDKLLDDALVALKITLDVDYRRKDIKEALIAKLDQIMENDIRENKAQQ